MQNTYICSDIVLCLRSGMKRGDIEKLTKKQALQILLDLYDSYDWYEDDEE